MRASRFAAVSACAGAAESSAAYGIALAPSALMTARMGAMWIMLAHYGGGLRWSDGGERLVDGGSLYES